MFANKQDLPGALGAEEIKEASHEKILFAFVASRILHQIRVKNRSARMNVCVLQAPFDTTRHIIFSLSST